jgi:hypothetical protein
MACPNPKCEGEIPEGEETCPDCGGGRKKKGGIFKKLVYLLLFLIVVAGAAFGVSVWTPHLDSVVGKVAAVKSLRDKARVFFAEKGWISEDLVPSEEGSSGTDSGGGGGDDAKQPAPDSGETTPVPEKKPEPATEKKPEPTPEKKPTPAPEPKPAPEPDGGDDGGVG